MDNIELFGAVKKMKKADILSLLQSAYSEMEASQRECVFGELMVNTIKSKKVINEDAFLEKVKAFYSSSLSGCYYSPFDINSKNYMDTPEETDEWCSKISLLLKEASQLSDLEKHDCAVECFKMLFDLMDRLGDDEIIFADEVGTWMIGADEKRAVTAYLLSLHKVATPNNFAKHIAPLLIRDSYESFSKQVYKKVKNLANKEQEREVNKVIKQHKIRVK